MGDLLGGVIGGVGSLLGAQSAKSNDLTGYSYLAGKNGTPGPGSDFVNQGTAANSAISQLTGTAPVQQGTTNAFNNYLNSTGYKFQQQQGSQALTGSAAARGLLGSGATAKALSTYGQNTAAGGLDNYLSQLNTQANRGATEANAIGSAGTQGGVQAGSAMQTGITGATGTVNGLASNGAGSKISNFFGGL